MSLDRAPRLGDFELIEYLAAGGMADLYLARSPRFDGAVVVKRIQSRYVELTRVVRMFIDEGRIAQALDHPNIVRVLDVGQSLGTYFIAMEYIPGRDLTAICRRGIEVGDFLPRPLAAAIVLQAARGLVYAHEKCGDDGRPLRVVHCDISPGNIVVSFRGTAKIVDFGIARAAIQLRAEDHSVAGKYNYMAPEQIRGEPVDARVDLFSLGVLLYELTVGKRLFPGRPEQVMRAVLELPIAAPSSLRPDYPPRLEAIVLRALARDRDARYPSSRALYEDLRAWVRAEGHPVGKRELAEYLRRVFAAPRLHEADEFPGPDNDEDEELALERPLGQGPLEVDPEGPDELPPLPPAQPYSPLVHADTAPLSAVPLGEPPTVPLRADNTRRTVLPLADPPPSRRAAPSASPAPSWRGRALWAFWIAAMLAGLALLVFLLRR